MALKVARQGGAPQRRPNMETRDTLKNILVDKIVHIPRGKERRGNIPRVMIQKSSRNPNHPLSMEKLRRGKKQKFGCLA